MNIIKTTAKTFTVAYDDYHVSRRRRNATYTVTGPAHVTYRLAEFQRVAKHCGWGAAAMPDDMVDHFGGAVPLFEVLHPEVPPYRIDRQ